jgi:L-asparaginase II
MHKVILQTKRGIFRDTCFFGSYFLANNNGIYESYGDNSSEICFMRSLAKPLQTSVLFDLNVVSDLNLTNHELAIFSGSHAGSDIHLKVLEGIVKKYKLSMSHLLLEKANPLDMRNFNGKKSKLCNNCSGKHLMMLLTSKHLGFNNNYTDPNHPLQQIIKKKQEILSEYKSEILTFDGCSTPLWGLPYENIIIAYFNLVKKHPELINAIIKNYYIYGGYDRFDSEIIKLGKGKLFAKVGAGGFVLIYNLKLNEILLVKMAQDNNEIRKIFTLYLLNKIKWLNIPLDLDIYNQQKQIVARYEFSL